MIFTDRTIILQKGISSINDTIILYRGDKEVEIRFTLSESLPFRFGSGASPNIIEKTEAAYGQLVIKTPNDLPAIFSEVAPTNEGKIVFTITSEMIDEITEVGNYTFQIRLFDESMNSRATLPEVVNGIEIREPIASEDTNKAGVATVGNALTTAATTEDVFDSEGNYNETTWQKGDRITDAKLNKIEQGITGVNDKIANFNNINDTTAGAATTYSSNKIETIKEELGSQIKDKANKNEVFSMANMGQDIKEAMTGGSVAVVGKNAILTENIVDGQVTYSKTDFLELDNSKQCYTGEVLRNVFLNQASSQNTTTKFIERENSLIAIVKIKPRTTYSILKEKSSTTSTRNVWTYTFSQDKITKVNKYSGNPRNTVNGTYTEITSGDNHNYLYINYTTKNENCYIQVAEGTNKNSFYAKGDYNIIIPKNISVYNKFEVDEKINNLPLEISNEVDVFQKVLFNKFLCIGDSITKGYRNGNYTDKTKSYPAFLSKLSGWECVNAGEAGFTSINWFNSWSNSYIKEGYDGYIIKLGQNGGLTDTIDTDCIGSSYLDYAETNTGCYCKIIERIMERTPKAKIFLVSIRSSATDTNDVIRKIAAKYNLPFIDLSKYQENLDASKFHVSASGSSYDVHFNTIGYTYLADAIYKGILKSIHEREDEYIDF